MELTEKAIELVYALIGRHWMYLTSDLNNIRPSEVSPEAYIAARKQLSALKNDYMDSQHALWQYISELEGALNKFLDYRFACSDTPGATERLDKLLYEAESAASDAIHGPNKKEKTK